MRRPRRNRRTIDFAFDTEEWQLARCFGVIGVGDGVAVGKPTVRGPAHAKLLSVGSVAFDSMGLPLRSWARTAGSLIVLLSAIALVSADLETVAALVVLCVVGYAGYYVLASSERITALYSSMGRRARFAGGILIATGIILATVVYGQPTNAFLVAPVIVLVYGGFRSGGVLRGAIYGGTFGVLGSIAMICLFLLLVALAIVLDVPGGRELLYKTLFAPGVVGFLGLIWTGFLIASMGLLGVICGSAGGAIARVT